MLLQIPFSLKKKKNNCGLKKNMVLFEVNSTPATPLDKSQPLVSFNHEWGEENAIHSWLSTSTPLHPIFIIKKMVLKLLV